MMSWIITGMERELNKDENMFFRHFKVRLGLEGKGAFEDDAYQNYNFGE